MKRKRSVFLPGLMILFAAVLIAALPTEAEGAIYEDTIRLHILANSDSDEDQAIKLALRDEILIRFGSELSESEMKSDAEQKISEKLSEIEAFANEYLEKNSIGYGAKAELSTEWYDTREYTSLTLPKGYYTSLRIILGNGDGKNWWCVMFPPLCLDAACVDAPADDGIKQYSDEEFKLISKDGYKVKFKILEIISDVFSS